MRVAASLVLCSALFATNAAAHGDHPHPPGEPTNHKHDEPAPEAPLEQEGVQPEDKAKTEAPAPATQPAPAPVDAPPATDEEGWRPRTLSDNNWRKAVRDKEGDGASRFTDFSHFYLEMRFGPYSPNIDDEPGVAPLYADYFGSDALFYFGLELDWLPLYIPYVGSLGAGFGWGITSASGQTFAVGTGEPSTAETDLTIFPMHVSGIFRADGILRELSVPIVPYIKAGFGFAQWTISSPNESKVERSPGGLSTGFHFAVGGALALNAFDRSAAMAMHEATGIRYANLFGEFVLEDLGSDGQLYVGTETFAVGIALDF